MSSRFDCMYTMSAGLPGTWQSVQWCFSREMDILWLNFHIQCRNSTEITWRLSCDCSTYVPDLWAGFSLSVLQMSLHGKLTLSPFCIFSDISTAGKMMFMKRHNCASWISDKIQVPFKIESKKGVFILEGFCTSSLTKSKDFVHNFSIKWKVFVLPV